MIIDKDTKFLDGSLLAAHAKECISKNIPIRDLGDMKQFVVATTLREARIWLEDKPLVSMGCARCRKLLPIS
jgi:hypothetical protein